MFSLWWALYSWLCASKVVAWAQVQASLVLLAGCAGWSWSAVMRRRERLRLQRATTGPALLLRSATAQAGQWPGVSVVMPVKGCRPFSASNWHSVVTSQYGGRVDYTFVVDTPRDPAVPALRQLAEAHPGRSIRTLVALPARTCSQKVANLLAGIEAGQPGGAPYLLLLDDDVALAPASLALLVDALEGDPQLFMATGYPFDVPPPGASLLTYATLAYHLPLLIAFSVAQRTAFVWGGCMMLRRRALCDEGAGAGVLQAWRRGGYSDDLLLAALCSERGLPIAAPSHAIFAQRLPASCPPAAYWNYLRRQLFVLDTYASAHNRRLNHGMAGVHAWASGALAVGALTAAAQLACCWVTLLAGAARQLGLAAGAPGGLAAPCQAGGGGGAGSAATCAAGGAGGGAGAQLPGSWRLLAVSAFLAHCAIVWMVREVGLLLRQLQGVRLPPPSSGAGKAGSPGVAGPCGHSGAGAGGALGATCGAAASDMARWSEAGIRFDWAKLWLGLLVESVLVPGCMAYTFCCQHVDWSGVRYHKAAGKVVRVERRGA